MSRLADYFVIVGYDHEKESELIFVFSVFFYELSTDSRKLLLSVTNAVK